MKWQQDSAGSWIATDALGYFFRVSQMHAPDGSLFWACAWEEKRDSKLRIGTYLHSTAEMAKAAMDAIAAYDAEVA